MRAIVINRATNYRGILWGGLLCGVLDLTAALIHHGLRGVPPVRILQSIAAGLLGRAAYQGGAATAVLGTMLHFLIAFTAAAVYYVASRKLTVLIRRPLPAGLLYGIVVYLFMNFVVLPLSNLPRGPLTLQAFTIGVGIHMLFVGLPISYAVRRYSTGSI
ncbi:MAG: hypothetical protein ACRD7E_01425 [Bryobacteraceae bacterium]